MINTKISTGGYESKGFDPGNTTLFIQKLEIVNSRFKEDAKEIFLYVRGEKIPGFEGFPVDVNDKSKGNLPYKVGKIRSQRFAYSDATVGNKTFRRDDEIVRFIKSLCIEMGEAEVEWLESLDNVSTVEQLIDLFNERGAFEDVPFYVCIGGKEYLSKGNGYLRYDLFLPRSSNQGKAITTNKDKVKQYDVTKDLIKLNKEVKEEFAADASEPSEFAF